MPADWWRDPIPAEPTDIGRGETVQPRCGRCRIPGDSDKNGRLMTYQPGNFHEKCAEREQADDRAWARQH